MTFNTTFGKVEAVHYSRMTVSGNNIGCFLKERKRIVLKAYLSGGGDKHLSLSSELLYLIFSLFARYVGGKYRSTRTVRAENIVPVSLQRR